MATSMAPAIGGEQRISHEDPRGVSAALRFFTELCRGMTRIPLRSLENMKAGTVQCAPVALYKLLAAGKRAGLPREWGLRVAVWVRAQVDALWPEDFMPIDARRQRVLELEGQALVREMRSVATRRPEDLLAEIRATEVECSAEQAKLGGLYAEASRQGVAL